MKQFLYGPEVVGLNEWPSGTLRLEGIDVTENPAEADLFVIPGGLTTTETNPGSNVPVFPNRLALERLPYFTQYEEKHVAFDCSDNEPLYSTTAIFIRCNTREWYLRTDPNTISWPWPVADYSGCIDLPEGGFKYDISFHGWNWSAPRKAAIASCLSTESLKCDIATYEKFYGYVERDDPREAARRMKEFKRSMKESRIALCPESIPGVFPYRFFEAMSAGRVPLLVGSDYVLPFGDEIPYGEFILQVEAGAGSTVGEVAARFIGFYSEDEIIAKGKQARHYYETYLHRDKWARLMADAVRKKVGVCV